MPFIRGHYYANPIVGGAIEAAREAEDAALASRENQDGKTQENDGPDEGQDSKPPSKIEIEIAELVPAHSGEAKRGYVARLHYPKTDPTADPAQPGKHVFFDPEQLMSFLRNEFAKNGAGR